MKLRWFAAIGLGLLLMSACDEPSPLGTLGDGCDSHAECEAGLSCLEGLCAEPSGSDADADVDGDADGDVDCADNQLNACGGCTALEGLPYAMCGRCSRGTWVCDGVEAVICVGDETNACGGCLNLLHEPSTLCGDCGVGTWRCNGENDLDCVGDTLNLCGGCESLEGAPGDTCGPCVNGELVCDDEDTLSCEGGERNECGGCAVLEGAVGDLCGECDGMLACQGEEALTCDGGAANECGECAAMLDSWDTAREEGSNDVLAQANWLDEDDRTGWTTLQASLRPEPDVDWYTIHVDDTSWGTIEHSFKLSGATEDCEATLPALPGSYELCVWWLPDEDRSGDIRCLTGDDEDSARSSALDITVGGVDVTVAGCCTLNGVADGFENEDLSSSTFSDDSGRELIRVRTLDDWACEPYTLCYHF